MPLMEMADVESAKRETAERIGDLSKIDVFGNNILVGIYMRGEKTKSGLIIVSDTRDEDKYQGKAGLVLKKGPQAFKDTPNYPFNGEDVEIGDWVLFRVSDGWPLVLNNKDGHCRMVPDYEIKGRIAQPDLVH